MCVCVGQKSDIYFLMTDPNTIFFTQKKKWNINLLTIRKYVGLDVLCIAGHRITRTDRQSCRRVTFNLSWRNEKWFLSRDKEFLSGRSEVGASDTKKLNSPFPETGVTN